MDARMLIPVPGPQAERNPVWDVAPGAAIRASSPHVHVQGRRPQGFRHHDLSAQGPEHRYHAPRGIMR